MALLCNLSDMTSAWMCLDAELLIQQNLCEALEPLSSNWCLARSGITFSFWLLKRVEEPNSLAESVLKGRLADGLIHRRWSTRAASGLDRLCASVKLQTSQLKAGSVSCIQSDTSSIVFVCS